MRETNDFYPTPQELANKAVDLIPDISFPLVCDAGSGSGIWGKAFSNQNRINAAVVGVELRGVGLEHKHYINWINNQNFLNWQTYYKFQITVSNPPYYRDGDQNMAERFLHKAFEITDGYILFLVRSTFLSGKGRYDRIFSKCAPTDIWYLVERPSFVNNKTEKGMEYALLLWNTKFAQNTYTTSHWLSWR